MAEKMRGGKKSHTKPATNIAAMAGRTDPPSHRRRRLAMALAPSCAMLCLATLGGPMAARAFVPPGPRRAPPVPSLEASAAVPAPPPASAAGGGGASGGPPRHRHRLPHLHPRRRHHVPAAGRVVLPGERGQGRPGGEERLRQVHPAQDPGRGHGCHPRRRGGEREGGEGLRRRRGGVPGHRQEG